MSAIRRLSRDEQGNAMIEFAIAFPLLMTMMWGVVQFGMPLNGNAGIQHALGEGARVATLCVNPTVNTGCRAPSNEQILARVREARFGTGFGTFGNPTIVNGPDGPGTRILTVSFSMPLNFLFFQGPTINLVRSKTIYMAGNT